MKFQKILIANRGEIAARIIRTCKRLGIQTVAVYSEADQALPYVQEADEAVWIGPPPVASSYLQMEVILEKALELGVDAIHPGYGFLSENAGFAERCKQEGIVFIGPSSDCITAMGSKIESRRRMKEAGVNIVPGCLDAIATLPEALDIAAEIGYPLMLKASAGGGGIGMSLVSSAEELEKWFESTRTRSQTYFGDAAVYLEKYIEAPRHIEVQVAADHHGNIVHLFERECSVQRRNQKVIEESPSPFLTEDARERLVNAAILGAKAIGYQNVGTMEFIFDEQGEFYFLEMNTRLQVEHPVTEAITGLDLVEWQIRIAEGERLPLKQVDIQRSGHAIECRLYAEDPIRLLPSPGTITRLVWPGQDVRVDTAVVEGTVVTPYYDPMIAKLIVHGKDRSAAIQAMEEALRHTELEGLKHNIPMLLEALGYEGFRSGKYDTQMIQRMRSQSAAKQS